MEVEFAFRSCVNLFLSCAAQFVSWGMTKESCSAAVLHKEELLKRKMNQGTVFLEGSEVSNFSF